MALIDNTQTFVSKPAAEWTSVNPILYYGQRGHENDTQKNKTGDGETFWNDLPYDAGDGDGTVTSVALSLPGIFSVSGSPITTAGTLTATLVNQNANLIFAGPSTGSPAAPTFRSLVGADIPNISSGLTGILPVANGGTNKSSWTQGSVVYAGTGGTALAENNAVFNWDLTNLSLQVGHAAPITNYDIYLKKSRNSEVDIVTENTSGGTSAFAGFAAINNVTKFVSWGVTGGGFTPSGLILADIAHFGTTATNGMVITARDSGAGSKIKFAVGGFASINEAWRMTQVGITNTQADGSAYIHLKAGTTAANSAPIKLTSGSLMTAPEIGALEFLTDRLYFTQTTGTTRQTIAYLSDIAASAVTGTGTTGKLTKWTNGAGGVIGDSIVSESSTKLTIAGNLDISGATNDYAFYGYGNHATYGAGVLDATYADNSTSKPMLTLIRRTSNVGIVPDGIGGHILWYVDADDGGPSLTEAGKVGMVWKESSLLSLISPNASAFDIATTLSGAYTTVASFGGGAKIGKFTSPSITSPSRLTASVENIELDIDLSSSKNFATGALATQRAVRFRQPTYTFFGASTLTNAYTVSIDGAPIRSTNATFTNTTALHIGAGAVGGTTTNSFGLQVNAQTGATNNYSAVFLGGNVGIGNSAPGVAFDVTGAGRFSTNLAVGVGSNTPTGLVSGATIGETALGYDNVRIGVANGTARAIFEDAGQTQWEIDNELGVLRIYNIGVIRATFQSSTGFHGIGSITAAAKTHWADNISAASWTINGLGLRYDTATFTNTSSAAASTVTNQYAHAFRQITFASSNAITVTNAVNVFIDRPQAGSGTTITNLYALSLGGALLFSGATGGITFSDALGVGRTIKTDTGTNGFNSNPLLVVAGAGAVDGATQNDGANLTLRGGAGNTGAGTGIGGSVLIQGGAGTSQVGGNVELTGGAGSTEGNILCNSNFKLTTAGDGIYVKEGTNATMGSNTLVAGTVTVSTTKVTASSRIYLTPQNVSGTAGSVSVSARVAGTSFTILSTSALDTRLIAWVIIEPS